MAKLTPAPVPAAMVSTPLPDAISRLLARPDLRIAPHERSIAFAPELSEPFSVDLSGHIRLGPACLARGEQASVFLRHALELALLLPRLAGAQVLAGLAAARTAALVASMRGCAREAWQLSFAATTPPAAGAMQAAWRRLARLQPGAPRVADADSLARVASLWALLGPAETLLQTGGDQRLRIDPATGLNGYGCSHRPRPWAVTFASSTASSSSERGFAGAEAARQRITLASLTGDAALALAGEAAAIKQAIATHCGLAAEGVVLAASGTDCELFALALCADAHTPVTNILVAPEETGSGVPLAAIGCHFAADTARGAFVTKGAPIEGFPGDVVLARLPARAEDGGLRPIAEIDAACAALAEREVAAGRRVILHLLDISKTGYLAPSVAAIAAIAARHPDAVRVVVDACQLRLSRARIADYLGRGWMVLITGSKFLTAPPFAGAVLLPPDWPEPPAPPPAGLAAYTSAPEWRAAAPMGTLADYANYGLLLRWHAALAEWAALAAVPEAHGRDVLSRFCARVRQGIAANPDLALFEVAPPPRPDDGWDGLQTIIGFIVRPASPLDPEAARRVYHWLNADLRAGLPPTLSAEAERLACLRCHIGQPVPLPGPGGRPMGVLRISAGARLVSGEPSHQDLDEEARLLREIRDALAVLGKISLILTNWDGLKAADPKASF